MSVKRYDLDGNADGYFDDPFMKVREKGKFVLHSDYAELEARHNALRHNTKVIIKAYRENRKKYNALVDAVAWERETDECGEWLHIAWWDNPKIDLLDIWDIHHAARAEVDRLIGEGK